jgi:hypothetical protein
MAHYKGADLIVTTVNACKHINRDNPMAVAGNIEKMYQYIKDIGLNIAVNYDDDNKPVYWLDIEYLNKSKDLLNDIKREA